MSVSFTVAIPTHDRRETVLLALRSVLAQTHCPAQIIVLCDGCTDGTPAAAAALDPAIEVLDLPKERGYAYEHRNRSLERARSDAIVWLGDDDLMLPDHLESIAARWGDGVDLVQTYAVRVDPDDAMTWMGGDWSVPGYRRLMLELANTTPMGAVCVRVEAARAAGGWNGDLPRVGDWDLWQRVVRAGGATASTETATLLHFRASFRVQAWPDRVVQNTRWLQEISDPSALAQLRRGLPALRSEREAQMEREIMGIRAQRDALITHNGLLRDAVTR